MEDKENNHERDYDLWSGGPEDWKRLDRSQRTFPADVTPQYRGRRHTLLWILGWIFIFPIPLTILMLRRQRLPTGLRYGIIAAGWIVYLLLGWARTHPAETQTQEPDTRAVVVTAPVTTVHPTSKPTTTSKPMQTKRPTATLAPTATPAQTEAPTPAAPAGVTPAFKETMDSYEAFFDEYIAFMKTLSDDPSNTALLLRYASMRLQYSDTMEKLDAIDETKLSPADDAYYLEVMTRIDIKLLQATQYMQ